MANDTVGSVKITLKKSVIGYDRKVRETIKSLGLHKINSRVVQQKTPDILGKIRKVSHLVNSEDINQEGAL